MPSTTTAARERQGAACGSSEDQRVAAIQRRRIIAAMTEACAELGAANVTVAHIVERSGISRRTFYEQFSDRRDCLVATIGEAISLAEAYVASAWDENVPWQERIRTTLAALLEFLEREPVRGRLLVVETLGAGAAALELRRQLLAGLSAAVDAGRLESKTARDLSPLVAESLVGGVMSVLHSRFLEPQRGSLLGLTNSLMSMIVLPYLGPAASRRELQRPSPRPARTEAVKSSNNPLRDLEIRLTYRTVRVLASVASRPGSSNREIGMAAGSPDQGQISKLLTRLARLGLIENFGGRRARGTPNKWMLTRRGLEVHQALVNTGHHGLAAQASRAPAGRQ
jgi:AcrR family transcriptional regulator